MRRKSIGVIVLGVLLAGGLMGLAVQISANPLGCWKCEIHTGSCRYNPIACYTVCESVSDGQGDGIRCQDGLGLFNNRCETSGGACLAITVESEEPDCRDFCP